MMDNLRAASNNVALKIILALIIVSFVLTGVSGYIFGGSQGYAAKVNGQEISVSQLRQAIQNDKERLSRELGDQFAALSANEEFAKQHRVEVLNTLIDELLLEQYAGTLGLTISNEQVRDAIRSQAVFQIDGVFDNKTYQTVLRNSGIVAEQYAEYTRKQLMKQQLSGIFTGTDFVLPSELASQAALFLQQRNVRLATINIEELVAKQQITDDELDAFYQQNKSQFAIPEQIKVSFIEIDAAKVQDNTKVTDEEIKAVYDKNVLQYTRAARYSFSFIQLKTEDEAKAVVAQLKEGADFAALAKEKSLDPVSAKNGGDLGWFDVATIPDEIKQANLSTVGQISEPIKSSFGYLVVRLNEIQQSQVQPLSEVSNSIAKQLELDKSKLAYYAVQQKVGDAIRNDKFSLQAAEQASGLKAVETEWFNRNNIPAELDHNELVSVLFNGSLFSRSGSPAANSDLIGIPGDRAFVLRVVEHKPESVKPLADVRDEAIKLLKQQKARAQAITMAEAALSELQAGKSEADVEKTLNTRFSDTMAITRQDVRNPLVSVVFNMPQPVADKPTYALDTRGDVVVIALDSVESGSVPEEMKEPFAQQLLMSNAYSTLEQLLTNLRQEGDININAVNSDI